MKYNFPMTLNYSKTYLFQDINHFATYLSQDINQNAIAPLLHCKYHADANIRKTDDEERYLHFSTLLAVPVVIYSIDAA